MNSTISFRRPEQLHVLSKLSVPPEADLASYVRRLQGLGYRIVEILPPLEICGSPQASGQEVAQSALLGNEKIAPKR